MTSNSTQNTEQKYSVLYIGIDPEAFCALTRSDRLDVVGIALIDALYNGRSCPINLLFKTTYTLQRKSLNRLAKCFYYAWNLFSKIGDKTYLRYGEYLRLIVFQNIKIVGSEDDDLINFLKENSISVSVVSGWSMLPDVLLKLPKYGTVNIHPSELPKYRGALPTLWALKNHDTYSAVTYMLPDRTVDGGNILKQYRFEILPEDNSIDIEHKIENIIKNTLAVDLLSYMDGDLKPVGQNVNIVASKTGKYEEYREIKTHQESKEEMINKVLLYPYLEPFCYCYLKEGGKQTVIKHPNHLRP